MGISVMNNTAITVPPTINGIRFPNFVFTLSEKVPKSGSKNKAKTLSTAIMAPVKVSPISKVFCKIKGMMLSYNCQNADMDRKASPIKKVRL